jgi:hypothetical protein
MKKRQEFVAAVALLLVGPVLPVSLSQADEARTVAAVESSDRIAEIENGLIALRDQLAQLSSWDFTGSLRITTPDAFLQALAPGDATKQAEMKVGRYRIHESMQGGLWMMQSDKLGKDDEISSSESFYVSQEAIVHKMTGRSRSATIVPTGAKSNG